MDTVTVNIGLAIGNPTQGRRLQPDSVLYATQKLRIVVLKHSIRESATEPTLIATTDRALTHFEAFTLSKDLEQECIAQRVNSVGELYGPQADKWKPFNPEYFLDHEGN